MQYKEIESYFLSEEGIEELLEIYSSQFNQVQEIADSLMNGGMTTQEEIEQMLDKITGLYMSLNIVREIASDQKKDFEGKENFKIIQERTAKKDKVVQNQVDAQVSANVQFIRRVRDIFQAYCGSAEAGKGSAQSRLKKVKGTVVDNG